MDRRFNSICNKVARKPHLAEDLYQEFFLSLCEIKDERLVKAKVEGYLEVLCVGIINNIWGKRYRVKTYENGTTSPMYELVEAHKPIENLILPDHLDHLHKGHVLEEHLEHTNEEYDEALDISNEKTMEQIKKIVEQKMDSSDISERFRARVWFYSNFKYKNPRQFSICAKIPYRVSREAHHAFRESLKKELKLCAV